MASKTKAPTSEYTEAETLLDDRLKMLPPVATTADLPASARAGQFCMVESEDQFYQFTDGSWTQADEDSL